MLARRNFFNDFMSDPFDFGFFGTEPAPKANASLMKTDVKETGKAYELDIDLPGFDKENVQIELNDGYLTINASTNEEKEDKDENGILSINVPKKELPKLEDRKRLISID